LGPTARTADWSDAVTKHKKICPGPSADYVCGVEGVLRQRPNSEQNPLRLPTTPVDLRRLPCFPPRVLCPAMPASPAPSGGSRALEPAGPHTCWPRSAPTLGNLLIGAGKNPTTRPESPRAASTFRVPSPLGPTDVPALVVAEAQRQPVGGSRLPCWGPAVWRAWVESGAALRPSMRASGPSRSQVAGPYTAFGLRKPPYLHPSLLSS